MKRNLTKPLVRRRGAITGWRSLAFAPMWALILLGTLVRLLSPSVAHANITSAAQGKLIDQGFQLFTNDTFNGNGRTCGTCHVPQNDYNISPADIAQLRGPARDAVFATNVPGLENPTLVTKLALFNINDNTPGAPGTGNSPAGPFRASMSIGGLAFTTLNNLANASPPSIIPGVDDGTRAIELGWAGDGTPVDPALFQPTGFTDSDCADAVSAFIADPTDLTLALNAFSTGAVRHHLTNTLNRVPGVDFRCPTPIELSALSAFQEYLGRRFEVALGSDSQPDPAQSVITFNDATAEKGKAIFLDARASCSTCHLNAGANDTIGSIKFNPQPIGAPPIPLGPPSFNGFETGSTIPVPGANKNSHTGVELLRVGLDTITSPVVFPKDPGDGVNGGGGGGTPTGGFNIQSLAEAARKKEFFHNGGFTTSVEDAASFYFTPTFDTSQSGHFAVDLAIRAAATPVHGCTVPQALGGTCGPASLASLASTYTGGNTQQTLNTLGFFLRSLSVVYSLADCERLVQDTIAGVNLGFPTTVQVLNCSTDLEDAARVIRQAKVKRLPSQYQQVEDQYVLQELLLQTYADYGYVPGLTQVFTTIQNMRHSIATITPDVP